MSDERSLLEQVTSAWRERSVRGEIRPSPAFFDLEPVARIEAFEHTLVQRRLEAAADPLGRSSTVRAILDRLR